MSTLGNAEILKNYKTAFFCSKLCPPELITKIYDWAIQTRDDGKTVVSGFHTPIEKDVLKFLLKGNQPVIICPSYSLKSFRIKPELKEAYDNKRILFLSPFNEKQSRSTKELSIKRNEFVIEIADEIVVGYAKPGGELEKILDKLKNKKIRFL